MQFTAVNAVSYDEMNFGRATINGVSLFEDEINALVLMYEDRKPKPEEDFNKFDTV